MADLLSQKVKFLRNKLPFGDYELALSTIKTKLESLTDGEIVLASYLKTEGEGEQAQATVRTLLGIRRDIGEGDARQTGYEIFDNEAANDAILALDANITSNDDTFVTVNVVEQDGKITEVHVSTNNIASAALLGQLTDTSSADTAFGKIKAEEEARTSAIEALDATVSSNTTNVNVSITETDGKLTGLTVSEDYAIVTRTETSSTPETPAANAAINVEAGDEGKLIKASDLAKVAAYAADKVTEEMHRVDKKIDDLGGDVTSDDETFVTVQVKTSAGEVSDVIVTQDMQAVASADASNKGLAEASDVKAYVDSQAAASTTVVTQGTGITVTESEEEDGHVEYQVASNLILAYNPSSEGSAATITLKSAVRDDETQVTYGTVNVSDIIGNGMLQSGSYNHETGILTLVFNTASGETQSIEINLASLLDIDDMIVGTGSQKYFEVKTVTGEGDVHNFQLDVKIKNVSEATADVTGLADAADVKKYVDTKASDLAVSAQGDDYVAATVKTEGEGADNKKVIITTDVQDVTASAGTRGTWTVSDAGVATLEGETAPSISGVEKSLMDGKQAINSVKTYVDAKVDAEAAERAAKIEGAIKALDVQDSKVAKSFVTSVSETDGKITVSKGTVTSTNGTVTLTDNTNGDIDFAVTIDGVSICRSEQADHVGQLTVGTIDCGTY